MKTDFDLTHWSIKKSKDDVHSIDVPLRSQGIVNSDGPYVKVSIIDGVYKIENCENGKKKKLKISKQAFLLVLEIMKELDNMRTEKKK